MASDTASLAMPALADSVSAAPIANLDGPAAAVNGSEAAGSIEIPPGMKLYTEGSASIIVPDEKDSVRLTRASLRLTSTQKVAFLNPAQAFNRDLSTAVMRTWSEVRSEEDAERKERNRAKKSASKPNKKRKLENGEAAEEAVESSVVAPSTSAAPAPYRFTLFEALSATGLRSIRYAKEIPLCRWVLANDLSRSAVEEIRKNVLLNGLGPEKDGTEGKVRVSEADAMAVMYSRRSEKLAFDVIDLDPYGTAAPFIDGAVQAVKDGGLLLVTCTDMAVLAGANYPEKAFSNYGGVTVKAEYCHELALRLVLHSLSIAAAKYGRFIQPILSLSIDFYVRVFVRVYASPAGTKKALTTTGTIYCCTQCQSTHIQPLGRMIVNDVPATSNAQSQANFKNVVGPPCPSVCEQCDGKLHVGGPMWIGPLHDRDFVSRVLKHLESAQYGTIARIKGMLSVARSELVDPFYFTPAKLAGFFHCTAPSLQVFAAALLNAGYDVSRSHAMPGSLKTNAPRSVVMDVMRTWIKDHPVNTKNVRDGSPARVLLSKSIRHDGLSFEPHAETDRKMLTGIKLVRYQETPAGHGPGKRASMKRKGAGDVQ